MQGIGLSSTRGISLGTDACEAATEPDLKRAIAVRRKQLQHGHELASQFSSAIDRLCGAVPEPSPKSSAPTNGDSHLGALAELEVSADDLNARLANSLARLQRSV